MHVLQGQTAKFEHYKGRGGICELDKLRSNAKMATAWPAMARVQTDLSVSETGKLVANWENLCGAIPVGGWGYGLKCKIHNLLGGEKLGPTNNSS